MMKRPSKLLAFLLALIMIIGMFPVNVFADEWDGNPSTEAPIGSGTVDEPYQISNAAELKWFADTVNSSTKQSTSNLCAVLTNNIDLEDNEWIPIGYYNGYSDCVYYGGEFDGNGKTVSGLHINTTKQYQALFGYSKGAKIRNLTVNGSVESSATSSAYAAGIVGYGYPVTIENCTNNANITSAKKGYLGGIVAGTTGGSSITNCNNSGEIAGCGDFVGGIVGSATGSASAGITTIKNCFNSASVTNTGTPSSYSYSTGGIAGGISGGSTISMCGNTGNVTSTLKRTGGIAGSLGGTVEKCFNTAEVIGTYGVGGIAGDSGDKTSAITSCYNLGNVKGISPTASFNDTNAKGIGGIIGGVASNSYAATLKDCYNAGTVTLDTTVTDVLAGGVVGDSSGKNYSGAETTGLVTVNNCYYLDTTSEQGNGRDTAYTGITVKTSDEMKDASFASTLGSDYIADTNGGYPLLGWQNPDAEYEVVFALAPSGANLTVADDSGNIIPSDNLTYHLKNGTYSYTVTGEECEAVHGSFTVAYSGQNISVNLKVKTYDFVFTTEPSDAKLTVDGVTPLADGRTYQLAKVGNPYTYKADAFGYEPDSGTVNVTGNSENDKLTVSLDKQEEYKITISYSKEEGGMDSDVHIQVKSEQYPNVNLVQNADGSFHLPKGNYTYSISSVGYKSVKGSFTVENSNLTLSDSILEIQTAWDGETITEPAQDSEGIYLITSPDELIWYQKNAVLTSSARLMSDIRINEENDENAYNWTPIGVNSSKAFTGDFDGNGHTISGLRISATGSNAGVFGYVGTGGCIHDLTIDDTIISANNGNYVGAVVGDLKGTIDNCHVTDTVAINGKSYVGGVVGELDNGGAVHQCSNAGTVTASADNAGGIAGRIYSNASNALTNSVNTGNVTAVRYAGGIAGTLYNNGTVENVYSTGNVTATSMYAGGLIGDFRYGTVQNAYTTSNIDAETHGGVFGFLESPNVQKTVQNVFYLNTISDDAVGNANGCVIQGTPQAATSDELKIKAEALGDAFYENDTDLNNGYPLLYWQVGEKIINPNAPTPDPYGWNGKTASIAPTQNGGVYQISTPSEFKWFAKAAKTAPDIKGELTADIDLNYQPWSAIGGSTLETAFSGLFDGHDFTITNLYIENGSSVGLFSYNAGEIKNLNVDGIVYCSDNSAAIAAYNNGKISNVNSSVNLTGGNHIAGIAAYNETDGTIDNCKNVGSIKGGQYVAGITSLNKGTVSDCGNSGAATGTGSFAAGVAADNNGLVQKCANNGQIIGKAAVRYAYAAGVVGRNNGISKELYNCGNVVGLGSSIGGCVGINTTGSTANGLYNAGDVCGSYVDTEEFEEFRVGGAIGEVVSGVSNAYTLDTLTISLGGELVSEEKLNNLAGALATMLPVKSDITGNVTIGSVQAEDTVSASYEGNSTNPIYIWYLFDGYDETTLAVSDAFTIPANLVGYRLYVKVMDSDLNGIVKGVSEPIDGFKGSVHINGYPVVGHTLEAVYYGTETNLSYQWYRGSTAIDGANNSTYTITDDDNGKTITVRVTGSKPGYVEQKTDKILTSEQAGIWQNNETSEPVNIAGTYIIANEAELKWFASYVNAGNTSVDAKLADSITLKSDKWYPIGNSKNPYIGTFDGNSKTINGLAIHSSYDEQGLFGNVGGKGEVKNLAVVGTISVIGDTIATGGIVGYLEGRISNCSFDGSINGVRDVGGIVGQTGLNSNVNQCINTAKITGVENIGGIAGSCSYGNITECVNTADIGKDTSKQVGGIAGYITNYAVVTACYNTGHIIGYDYLGGIAGVATVCASPQGCYNVGKIDSGMHAFGVLGDLSGTDYISSIKGSYYLADSEQSATDKTAQGISSDGMKKSAFVSLLNAQSGAAVFAMDTKNKNNGYPLLIWQIDPNDNEDDTKEPEQPDVLTVSFTLSVETSKVNEFKDWLVVHDFEIEKDSTAYDLFKKILNNNGYSYEANGNSYVSSITNPEGVTLEEFGNGPRSGWMYTINDKYPDYMAAVKLNDGDEMRFFYTNDYRNTNWNPADPVVTQVENLIEAIGNVTIESGEAIETARLAYDMLTNEQKFSVSNYEVLEEAENTYNQLIAEKTTKDKTAAEAVDKLIDAIGTITLESRKSISAARNAYNSLTEDQKAFVTKLAELENAEKEFANLVGEKTANDIAAANEVDLLINAIGSVTVRSKADIEKARKAYNALTDEQKEYVTKEADLIKAEKELKNLISEQDESRFNIYKTTGNTLLSGDIPNVSAIGGEWIVLGLARSERISDEFKAGYYNNLVQFLKNNGSEQMHRTKSTENARAIIALSALGYDATDVAGYNLLLPLCDMCFLDKQGVNGSIWALIAFDTVQYDIPTVDGVKEQTTREKLIQNILSEQTENGSWLLDDEIGDVDLTAMAILALAPYVKTNSDVKAAVDYALEFLSKQQRADGGYISYGKSTSESCAQIIVALTSLGIDPDNDERFIKNGHSVLDKLISFYQDGAFKHVMNESVDQMATEQAYYALASYYRFLDNKTALYDMRDVHINNDIPVIGDDNKPTVPPADDKEDITKPPTDDKEDVTKPPANNDNEDITQPSTDKSNMQTPSDNKSDVPTADNSDNKNAVDTNAKSPETGNNSALFVIWIFAMAGIIFITVSRKKEKQV